MIVLVRMPIWFAIVIDTSRPFLMTAQALLAEMRTEHYLEVDAPAVCLPYQSTAA